MRRVIKLGSGTALTLFALALPASGQSGGTGNQYQGRAEKDTTTYVGFDVQKSHGKARVERITAELKYTCASRNAEDDFAAFGFAKGALPIKHGKFSGELPWKAFAAGRGASQILGSFKFSGKLLDHGGAKGMIGGNITFTGVSNRDTTKVRCYSGALPWKTKKGAMVSTTRQATAVGGSGG